MGQIGVAEAEAGTRQGQDPRFETESMKRVQKEWHAGNDPMKEWFSRRWEDATERMKEAYSKGMDAGGDLFSKEASIAGATNDTARKPAQKRIQK